MPNTSIPATAEGLTEIHIEKRIAELAGEISHLMDRSPNRGQLIIFRVSTGQKPRYEAAVALEGPALLSTLVKAVDKFNEGRSFLDLVNFALESMSGDPNYRKEINALQYGMDQAQKHLEDAKIEFEKARLLADE